jgi:hypothetical protein
MMQNTIKKMTLFPCKSNSCRICQFYHGVVVLFTNRKFRNDDKYNNSVDLFLHKIF